MLGTAVTLCLVVAWTLSSGCLVLVWIHAVIKSGRTAVTWSLIAEGAAEQLILLKWAVSGDSRLCISNNQQPLYFLVSSLLNVILSTACSGQTLLAAQHWGGICQCARLFFGHIMALGSFPTCINVSYFEDLLMAVCTCLQLRTGTIIKEEFKLVMSSKLLCLWPGWFWWSQLVRGTSAESCEGLLTQHGVKRRRGLLQMFSEEDLAYEKRFL